MPSVYGLAGHPVKHSFSPAMHQAAFLARNIDGEYRLFDIAPEAFTDFLRTLPAQRVRGINVTIPHKVAAWQYLKEHGELDKEALKLGAVNTVKVEHHLLKGFNTDGAGFYRSLVMDLKFQPEGKRICFLGAGGAARAVIMYLGNGPRAIYVMDVDQKKTEDLKRQYALHCDAGRLHAVGASDISGVIAECDLLVNATPVGMKEGDPSPVDFGLLHQRLYIYDLVYNRRYTALTRYAQKEKMHAAAGLGMLLFQGAIAFEIWTGKKAPIAVMKKALKRELAKCL